MGNLLHEITDGSNLVVSGRRHRVLAKMMFVTESKPFERYTKIFLSDHHVLLLTSETGTAYYGLDVGDSGIAPGSEEAVYKGTLFKLAATDYQIPIALEFGDPLQAEGEVRFWDYSALLNDEQIISVAIVARTGLRSDVVAQSVDATSIRVERQIS